MPHNNEAQYHIQEAINHLQQAGTIVLQQAPADDQSVFQPSELAGNELLLIADHLANVRKVAQLPVTGA
ncbi:hypothetical protein [Arsukibacterium sp.]|uniref:hypothetical protein n=1 Tax=Arsukibacterium sp. TaxID=1977258 RepID=UPI00299D1AAE|nr:hypothetical protein [Arsukibacterium sp.]MDX1538845.1 hypothetical protein [Arsukibacterium sp.]